MVNSGLSIFCDFSGLLNGQLNIKYETPSGFIKATIQFNLPLFNFYQPRMNTPLRSSSYAGQAASHRYIFFDSSPVSKMFLGRL